MSHKRACQEEPREKTSLLRGYVSQMSVCLLWPCPFWPTTSLQVWLTGKCLPCVIPTACMVYLPFGQCLPRALQGTCLYCLAVPAPFLLVVSYLQWRPQQVHCSLSLEGILLDRFCSLMPGL